MPETLTLTTTLHPRGPAAAVLLTDEQLEALGGGKKVFPVTVTVNGSYTFQGRVGRMGGETMVGFNKATRAAAGVEAGDEIEVELTLDAGERTVEIPDDLAAALAADPEAKAGFDALAFTHRKEYARSVADAKRPETREKRIATALEGARASKPPRG